MSFSYNIDTSLNVNGGLTINGDTSIPSTHNLYVGGNITGNTLSVASLTGNTAQITTINGTTANLTNINATGTISGNNLQGNGSGITNLSTSAMPNAFLIDGSRSMAGDITLPIFQTTGNMYSYKINFRDTGHNIKWKYYLDDNTTILDGLKVAGYQGVELYANGGAGASLAFFKLSGSYIATPLTLSGNTTVYGQFTSNNIISTTSTLSGSTLLGNGSSLTINNNSSVNGGTNAISTGWAYTHEQKTGSMGHIPTGGTNTTFLRGDNTWVVPTDTYVTSLSAPSGGNGTLTVSQNGATNPSVNLAHTHPFSQITSLPTTLSGYGITDATSKTMSSYGSVPNLTTSAFFPTPLYGDKLRWRLPQLVEYYSGGAWVTWSTNIFDILTDGKGNTNATIDYNHSTFRLTYSADAYSNAQLLYVGASYNAPTGNITIDSSNNLAFSANVSNRANAVPSLGPYWTYATYNDLGSDTYIRLTFNWALASGNSFSMDNLVAYTSRPDNQGGAFDTWLPFGWDAYKNITMSGLNATNITANAFTENGMLLSNKYLGINATATNATNFNGLNSGQFLRSDLSTNLSANINIMDSTERHISGNITNTGFFFNSGGVGLYDWKNSRFLMSYNQSANTLNFNATNFQISGNNVWTNGNDGSGSGLDADTVDGQHASSFAPSGYGLGTIAHRLTSGNDLNLVSGSGWYDVQNPTNGVAGMSWHNILQNQTADWNYVNQIAFPMTDNLTNHMYVRNKSAGTWGSWSKVWTDSNMGSGSGLNSDMVDGIQGSQIVADTGIYVTNQDWSTLTGNGVYRVGAYTGANSPTGAYTYGTLEVIQTNNSVTQNYYSHSSGQNTGMWTRTKWNASDWTVWKKIWTDNNMGSGSLLDADTVDGLHATAFVKADGTISMSGTLSIPKGYSTSYSYEYTMALPAFANGVANQKVDLEFPTFWGSLELSLTCGYNFQDSAGILTKLYGLGLDVSGNIYVNQSQYTESLGLTSQNFAISDASWDSVNSKYKVTIVHRASTGNTPMLRIRALAYSSGDLNNIKNMTVGSVYTTDTTVYAQPVAQIPDNTTTISGNTVWHQGNDGSGSGLDADTVDGLQGSQLLRSDVSGTLNGVLTVSGSSATPLVLQRNTTPNVNIQFTHSSGNGFLGIDGTGQLMFGPVADLNSSGYLVWHSNNFSPSSKTDVSTFNTHTGNTGIGSHIPTGGTTSTYLRGDGTWVTPIDTYVTGISSTSGGNGMLTVNFNNAIPNLTLDLTHNHDSSYLGISGTAVNSTLFNNLSSNQFVRNDSATTMGVGLLFNATATGGILSSTPTALSYGQLQAYGTLNILADTDGSHTEYVYISAGYPTGAQNNGLSIGYNLSNFTWKGYTIWHSGNDGAGSGLDADLLDGHDSTYFAYVGQNNLFKNMSGGVHYDSGVDMNTLQTVGEYRFLNIASSGSANMPSGASGMGYYFGMGGGDVGQRGFQLLGTSTKQMYFREISTGTWCKIWSDQNQGAGSGLDSDTIDGIQSSQLVRNDVANQAVNTGFTMSGNAYVGMSNGSGALYIRTGAGSVGIQLAGDNSAPQSGVGAYLGANGTATFTGTMTANAIAVTSTALVTNLNSQMINSVKEPQLAKNTSVYELGGMGVYTGTQVQAQGVPNMTVQLTAGTVYTNTGMRVTFSTGGSYAFATPSATYNRIDSIYVQGSSAGANEGVITVMTGTAQASPVAPTIPSDGVLLANVTIRQNAGSILSTDITDMRVWKPIITSNMGAYVCSTLFINGLVDNSNGNPITFNKPIKNTPSNNSITIPAGSTSYTWTHNLNLANYIVKLSWNNPEPHVTWSNKTANAITVNLDNSYDTATIIDIGIEAF